VFEELFKEILRIYRRSKIVLKKIKKKRKRKMLRMKLALKMRNQDQLRGKGRKCLKMRKKKRMLCGGRRNK